MTTITCPSWCSEDEHTLGLHSTEERVYVADAIHPSLRGESVASVHGYRPVNGDEPGVDIAIQRPDGTDFDDALCHLSLDEASTLGRALLATVARVSLPEPTTDCPSWCEDHGREHAHIDGEVNHTITYPEIEGPEVTVQVDVMRIDYRDKPNETTVGLIVNGTAATLTIEQAAALVASLSTALMDIRDGDMSGWKKKTPAELQLDEGRIENLGGGLNDQVSAGVSRG